MSNAKNAYLNSNIHARKKQRLQAAAASQWAAIPDTVIFRRGNVQVALSTGSMPL
jgi:hypothetical protein